MWEDMQLHGFSRSTQLGYVRSIAKLAQHYHKSPDLISEEELRQYFLELTQKKKVSRSTATIDLCAIKFFFAATLWVIPLTGLILLSLYVTPSRKTPPSAMFNGLIRKRRGGAESP